MSGVGKSRSSGQDGADQTFTQAVAPDLRSSNLCSENPLVEKFEDPLPAGDSSLRHENLLGSEPSNSQILIIMIIIMIVTTRTGRRQQLQGTSCSVISAVPINN